MTPITITPPDDEPISLAEAKVHLRVVASDEDGYIQSLITTARQAVEQRTNRAMLPQTIAIGLDYFGCTALPKPPFRSITSVKYLDPDGAEQTLDPTTYNINKYVEPARLDRAAGKSWPAVLNQAASITVTYSVGYADEETVPAPLKQWMLLAIGAMYENREQVIVGTIVAALPEDFMGLLWQPYMVYE